MATIGVVPSVSLSAANPTASYANVSGQSAQPMQGFFRDAPDNFAASQTYAVPPLATYESVAPFPPNAGPAAGASAVIGVENHGLLSVAAAGLLFAGIASGVIPIIYELSGSRVKVREEKYLAANTTKNETARVTVGSGYDRVFKHIEQEHQHDVAHAVARLRDDDVQKSLAKLRSSSAQPISPDELHALRQGVLRTLLERAGRQDEPELARAVEREQHILKTVGPGDHATIEPLKQRSAPPSQDALRGHFEQRSTFRSPELHAHNRFLGIADGIAWIASEIAHFHHSSHTEAVYEPGLEKKSWSVERPKSSAEVQAFYGRLHGRPQPWVRAIHSASYIDQRWPGLLAEAADAKTRGKDQFEVWIEHPIPQKRVITDMPIADAVTRPVAVFAHRPENDVELKNVDYSLGRELDVAYGNYRAFKAGPAASKLRQVLHRYSLYLWGAKDTMANPKGMGLVLANLGVTSITLSALLYGMLYLVEYMDIQRNMIPNPNQ